MPNVLTTPIESGLGSMPRVFYACGGLAGSYLELCVLCSSRTMPRPSWSTGTDHAKRCGLYQVAQRCRRCSFTNGMRWNPTQIRRKHPTMQLPCFWLSHVISTQGLG